VFHLQTTIGVEITIDDLFARGFDAIFIGTGTGVPKRLTVPGNHHPAVRQAIRYLRRVSLYENGYIPQADVIVGKNDKVFIVGCGNTAMDAARTALRMGAAEVTVIYHRTVNEMTALRAEYDDAVKEGVKFLWNSSITEVKGRPESPKLDSIIVDIDGKSTELPADHVVMAIGSSPAARIVSSTTGIEIDSKGYVITTDTPYGMSTRKGVFAGGDVTNRPATVVHAMQDAKLVADGIARYVDAIKLLDLIEHKNN